MWSKPESRKHHNYHHYDHHECLMEKQGRTQAYSVTKFGSLILPFPYFITMYSEMTYMRTTARNLVVMHFISFQLSRVSGKKNKDDVMRSKIKRILERDTCIFTIVTSININIG